MNPAMKGVVQRVLPKVKLRDVDWKWAVLLVVALFLTTADDFTGIGVLLDVFELPVDAIIAMILSRNSIRRAVEREGVTVQGKVVDNSQDATKVETKG